MDVLFRAWRAVPWFQLWAALRSRAAQSCAAGALLGVLAACAWTQFVAHWGTSMSMQRGAAVAILMGLCCGIWLDRTLRWSWPLWLTASATVTLILPWWLDRTAGWFSLLPADSFDAGQWLNAVGIVIALLSVGVPVSCWTATACRLCRDSSAALDVHCAGWGCAGGVLWTALCFGPWLGTEVTAVIAAAMAMALAAYARRRADDTVTSHADRVTAAYPSAEAKWMLLPGAFLLGGAWTIAQQHCQWLVVTTVAMQQTACAVLIAGVIAGVQISGRWQSLRVRPWLGALLGVTTLCALGWMFEFGIQFRLWSSAYLINVTLHQLATVGLVALMLLPISLSGGLMIGSTAPQRLFWGVLCFLGGGLLFAELLPSVSPHTLTTVAIVGLAGVMIVGVVANNADRKLPLRFAAPLTALAGCLIALRVQPAISPAKPAKLLFSTQTFLAYRSEFDAGLLPQLDEARLIATATGQQGPLTLWKSRGTDLLLREAGIPRCSIACRPDISPQSSPEVLATVFPLMVAQEARNVMLLGSSGGVPLATCLSFPVQQVVCVEPDAARVDLIRGPIAAHQGSDPFADERVTWDRRPIEFAAAMSDGGYDIILSSPPPTSTVAALPQFTQEFYRQVSGKLSPAGLFCQRLEAVDFGPRPVQLVVKAVQAAFRDVVAVEIGVGDFLLMATNSDAGLVPKDLPERLETPHVRRLLAKCGWDWSTLLTLPAWDHAALQEFAADGSRQANTASNCQLAFTGPRDTMRWGPKLQETQTLLTKRRTSEPAIEVITANEPAQELSRRSRYLDWLGEKVVTQDLLRRLSEVAAQAKIVHDNPDAFWLEYRKALRDELQQRPRTEIRRVSTTDETERVLHPEDERRKSYFIDLGVAGDLEERNLDAVYGLRRYFEPYDPLVSLFARQETAELMRLYGHPDPAYELSLRLHVINFAPSNDCSLRNVIAAAELLLESEAAIPDPQTRFDTMNGLLQTIRGRWSLRSAAQVKSVRFAIQDADRSALVIDRLIEAMDRLATTSQVDAPDWTARKEVVSKVLLRPLRNYRAELQSIQQKNKAMTDSVIQDAKKNAKF